LWIEYIDGVSGKNLTLEMFEKAAFELGRFQGRLYKEQPDILKNISCFGEADALKRYYMICREKMMKRVDSVNCEIPDHLIKLLKDKDNKAEKIFFDMEKLPVVLCHRDFWFTNIFYSNGEIILIDWDTTGWGYIGEDAAQLIFDETDVDDTEEYYRKIFPAYFKGFSEYIDISKFNLSCIWEMIVLKYGEVYIWQMLSESPDERNQAVKGLQKIYEMQNIKL